MYPRFTGIVLFVIFAPWRRRQQDLLKRRYNYCLILAKRGSCAHWIGSWVDSRAGVDLFTKEIISFSFCKNRTQGLQLTRCTYCRSLWEWRIRREYTLWTKCEVVHIVTTLLSRVKEWKILLLFTEYTLADFLCHCVSFCSATLTMDGWMVRAIMPVGMFTDQITIPSPRS
jgi:hypothetical protein